MKTKTVHGCEDCANRAEGISEEPDWWHFRAVRRYRAARMDVSYRVIKKMNDDLRKGRAFSGSAYEQ